MASGKILKKYRCMTLLHKKSGIGKRAISHRQGKLEYGRKSREELKRKLLQDSVTSFLDRDDNSRMMPGKADYKSCPEGKVQKRMTIYTIFMKNTEQKIPNRKYPEPCSINCAQSISRRLIFQAEVPVSVRGIKTQLFSYVQLKLSEST